MTEQCKREKVCLVGSGNWGSCVAKIIGENMQQQRASDATWDPTVTMWVYEELVDGRKLTDIINCEHKNPKYLPGVTLPHNVRAEPDLLTAVAEATLLVFVVPHQFLGGICEQLRGQLDPRARAISLVKGLDCLPHGLHLVSRRLSSTLALDVSVLMGANLANDIAQERFSEATIGYVHRSHGELWKRLFDRPYFRITLVQDVTGVELCGALKNVVALAAGFVDGLYSQGGADNTKAAVLRRGLLEMRALCRLFDPQVRDETFLESCGIADLITSSYGGRNRRLAEAFVRAKGSRSLEQLETELLHGQKLQGPPTALEVFRWLDQRGEAERFPLFTSVYRICHEQRDPSLLFHDISSAYTLL